MLIALAQLPFDQTIQLNIIVKINPQLTNCCCYCCWGLLAFLFAYCSGHLLFLFSHFFSNFLLFQIVHTGNGLLTRK